MSNRTDSTLDDWIAHEAISFSLGFPGTFNAAVDELAALLGDRVELLGLGEALHGGAEILTLRNRLFQRLVEAHGYSAIALESSFPRSRLVNEYVAGLGPQSYEDVKEAGFSHGFGGFDANRELVEWMREYNSNPSHKVKLRFYGFDSPTEVTVADSPRHVLHFVLDYLSSIDSASGKEHGRAIDSLLGSDSDWENPEAAFDPAKGIGQSSSAAALRTRTEDLISELQVRRPELVAKSSQDRYLEAVHCAESARRLLNYHAGLARKAEMERRVTELMGLRDAMMADNLVYIANRERGRGKVLAFAHNSHLQLGAAMWDAGWQPGSQTFIWWPAGAHLREMLGLRYSVMGTAVGISEANGIGKPEAGTLEAMLTGAGEPGAGMFIPTHRGQGLSASEMEALPIRSGSVKNRSYFPLTHQSFADFDWLAVLDRTEYARGGPKFQ